MATQIELAKCLNLQDNNIYLENFFRDLLNRIYTDRKFRNLNEVKGNFTAIDLADDQDDIVIQVTSDTKRSKVADTLKKYKEQEYSFKKLIMLYGVLDKPKREEEFSEKPKELALEEWDLKDLLKYIEAIDGNDLAIISEFVESELLINSYKKIEDQTEEINAIIDVLEYLSSNKSTGQPTGNQLVDPKGKVTAWLKDMHAVALSQYAKLWPLLYNLLEEARKQFAQGNELTAVSIGLQLEDLSIKYLQEADGDANIAIEKLTDYLLTLVKGPKSRQAIKFYVIDELILCNVFPPSINSQYGIDIQE